MNAVVEVKGDVMPQKPEPSEANRLLSVIERVVSDPSIDVAKIDALLKMQERVMDREAQAAFNRSMAECQAKMRPVAVDASNPQTSSKYASFAALDRALRPIYTEHGFALSFDEGESPKPDHIRVLCHLSHRDGFTRTYHRDMPVDNTGMQGKVNMTRTHASASAQSYAMRYLERLIFNVAVGEDDDDGNQGGGAVELLSPAQVKDIKERLKRANPKGDQEKELGMFLKWAKVKTLEEIRADALPMCIQSINTRAAQVVRAAPAKQP